MKILVVDDSRSARMIIRKELEFGGYDVVEAGDGLEAIEVFRQEQDIALVTMDVDMPQLDGYSACQEIKKVADGKELPVVFVTANDTVEDRIKGFELGATDFINKPFKKGDLLPVINKILSNDMHLQGTMALVVEDSDVPRMIIAKCLIEQGVRVLEAKDGAEALEMIEHREEEIDLVISDLEMPRLDGLQLCRAIRDNPKMANTPLIIISSNPNQEIILKLFKWGASDYIIKPFMKEELLARVRVWLETKLINRTLKSQVCELDRLNRAKNDFLAVCSQDLRAPLNGMVTYTNLMLQDAESYGEDVRDFIKAIKSTSEYLIGLINDILDLNKIEHADIPMERIPLAIVEVLQTSIKTARLIADPKKVSIELVDKSRYGEMSGNLNALYRIFNHLLSNAVNHSPAGECVVVRVEQPDAKEIQISIEDKGDGMTDEQQRLLFENHQLNGDSRNAAHGLRMGITHDLVEKLNGRVDVVSNIGLGSKFTVVFPTVQTLAISL